MTESDCEIVSTRVFDAPRALIWRAWRDAEHIAVWWGPKGFTNSFAEFDFRPGGLWNFVMHGPDGHDYPNESRFVEIVEPSLIVLDHLSAPKFRLTAQFEDLDGATKLIFRQRFETAEICAKVRVYAAPANEELFDRLAARLLTLGSD